MIWYLIVGGIIFLITLGMLLNYRIISSCRHKWVKVEKIDVYDGDKTANRLPMGYKYVMQCSKCGEVKHYKCY